MGKMLKPPHREMFAGKAQQLLWEKVELWLAANADLLPNFYECERDSSNGRYHNCMIELQGNDQAAFGIRLHLPTCVPQAILRLGYWGKGFSKRERRVGSFFSVILTKEVEDEAGAVVPDGLPDDLYADKVMSLLDDAANGKIKVNVTKLGDRPIKWSIYRWSDIGWIELGATDRASSFWDILRRVNREQLTFVREGIG